MLFYSVDPEKTNENENRKCCTIVYLYTADNMTVTPNWSQKMKPTYLQFICYFAKPKKAFKKKNFQ